MAITLEELENLLTLNSKLEKVATVSSDGRNLLLRIPKEIRDLFRVEKGDKVRFIVDEKNRINFEIIKENAEKKKERT